MTIPQACLLIVGTLLLGLVLWLWRTRKRSDNVPEPLVLSGDSDHGQRVAFVTVLLESADSKINHFDSLRQRNLVISLGIFAGISGFAWNQPRPLEAGLMWGTLTLLMIAFLLLDRRLSIYSHGWQRTRRNLIRVLAEVIEEKGSSVTFHAYDADGERLARWIGLKSILHLLLAIGAPLSFLVSQWLRRAA